MSSVLPPANSAAPPNRGHTSTATGARTRTTAMGYTRAHNRTTTGYPLTEARAHSWTAGTGHPRTIT
jgi:hypothetical protein